MKFIDNAKAAWKHYSTLALAAASGVQGAWLSIPEPIKANLPELIGHAVSWITLAVVIAGLFGKFVDQTPKDAP